MKKSIFTCAPLLILTSLFPFLAQAAAPEIATVLTEQNYRVLSGRVHKILAARLSDLSACTAETRSELQAEFNSLPAYSDKKQVVVTTLDLYLRSYIDVAPNCRKSMDRAEQSFHREERAKFTSINSVLNQFCVSSGSSEVSSDRRCKLKMHQFFADLDPHCVSAQVPNASNKLDPNPCMAADYLVGKSLVNEHSWESFLFISEGFLENLRQALSRPEAVEKGVDLWQVYLQDNQDKAEYRETFLAEMDLFFSSSLSEGSYIRGFHDHIWSFILFKTSSPEKAVDYFINSRLIVDQYRTANKWADLKHIALNIHGIKMQGKNRHNYMAAFLGCHYRNENKLFRETLPILLGYAYETLDFKSHIVDDHDSFNVAKENFVTDTTRYRTGAYWGYQFCKMQF